MVCVAMMVLMSWPAARSALMRARRAVERARGMVAVIAVDDEGRYVGRAVSPPRGWKN